MAQKVRPVILTIVVSPDCPPCDQSSAVAERIAAALPDLRIEFLNVGDDATPGSVVATPTYLLDDIVVSLGNPEPAAFIRRLREMLAERR